MVDESTQSTVSRIVGLLVAGGAVWAAQHLVSAAWRAATGHTPPKAEAEGESGLAEVAAAAVITGAIGGLARVLATRGAAKIVS